MPPAIVLNSHYNGMNLGRELGRHGVRVLALDSAPTIGRFSRYLEFRLCPDPLVSERAFIDHLRSLAREFDEKPILFPTNDHWAAAVSRNLGDLADGYLACVADWPAVSLALHKQDFGEWARARGYPVPASWRARAYRDVPPSAFPLVAKPEYRRMATNDEENFRRAERLDDLRMTVLEDIGALAVFATEHADVLDWMILQPYIRGLSDTMYTIGVYVNRSHEVVAMFTGRKVRGFPPDSGDCVVGQSEDLPAELKEIVHSLCRELRYQGIAEFEFKREATTGRFWLIEVNPRSWSWVGITPSCGVNLPWIAYSDMAGLGSTGYVESSASTGAVKYASLVEDFVNCVYGNRRAGYPEWHMTPGQWWRSLRADRLVSAEFAWDDPLPGFYVLARTAWRLGGSAVRNSLGVMFRSAAAK